MVSCRHVLAELSNYLDNEVAPELRQEIEQHLRGCRRCSVVFDSVKKVLFIFSDEGVLEVPPDYSERLHSRLAAVIGR